ncbi:MAG TPA: hypothetical protein VKQ30_04150 [Ktedonobacterales bacterium]|nr:hypothetical protein [Ktedonobacterales bacterium]
MSHRNTHYWLWFLLFGLIGGLLYYNANNKLDSESIWLLASGLLGLVVGMKWLNEGKWTRPYDIIIGIVFTLVGILGILQGFRVVNVGKIAPASIASHGTLLGLSLTGLAVLINTVLGLTSLNHGLKSK